MTLLRLTAGRVARVWVFSVLVVLAIGGCALHRWMSEDRRLFVPGATSSAHYQIEIACHTCHTPFEGVKQEACLSCHAERLARANDTHPATKFSIPTGREPRGALDATRCVSCHKEHAPHITRDVAVTQPAGFCVQCHADLPTERPSHRTFAFTSCATVGCHNYHDNRALHEGARAAPRDDPAVLPRPVVPTQARATRTIASASPSSGLLQEWEMSAHARVACPDCHEGQGDGSHASRWTDRPQPRACATCHAAEVLGFLDSRHGMRLRQALSPMTPGMARLPMKADAHARELTCTSCHGAHRFDQRTAAVEGCLACHDDDHSRAYLASPHAALWRAETAGRGGPGTGVSCATCHMPRGVHTQGGTPRVLAEHNQNDNLRPVSKMLRSVCLHCHGLTFSVDALADRARARKNDTGRPSRHVAGGR